MAIAQYRKGVFYDTGYFTGTEIKQVRTAK